LTWDFIQEKLLSRLSPWLRGHTVLCRVGRNGMLIYDLLRENSPKEHKIVLIEKDNQNAYSQMLVFICRDENTANLDSAITLKRQGLSRLREATIFCRMFSPIARELNEILEKRLSRRRDNILDFQNRSIISGQDHVNHRPAQFTQSNKVIRQQLASHWIEPLNIAIIL
jgi:hypothetical protein